MNIKMFLKSFANKAGYDVRKLNSAGSLRTMENRSVTS